MTVLEFWPDYGSGPLWSDGKSVDLASLGLDGNLIERVAAWHADYSEEKVPVEGTGNQVWLAEGIRILGELRGALRGKARIVVTEPWWGEVPI